MADFVSIQNQHLQLGHPQSLEQRLALAFATTGESLWKGDLVEETVAWSTIDLSVFSDGVTETSCSWAAWLERIHAEDRGRVAESWGLLKDGSWKDDDWRLEFRLANPDGEFRDVRVQTLVAKNSSGQPLRVVGTLRDITQQKQAERERRSFLEALQESEQRFRELAENITEVFWLTSPDGLQIFYVSPAYQTVWGKPSEDVRLNPLKWLDSICEEDRPAVERHLARMATEGRLNVEYRIVRPDDTLRWIHDNGFPIRDADGHLQRIARIATDITERKAIAQALSSSNEELETFCYSVSHDLRAPLRHIDGFSQAVLEDFADKLDVNGQEMLGMIRESTRKMGALIDDILTLSRVSRREMHFEDIRLGDLAREVIQELCETGSGTRARFHVGVEETVRGDRWLLRQALSHLIDNARKFSAPRAEPVIELLRQPSDSGGEFFVRDNGVGFNMQFQDKLFVPFQRLHRETEFSGSGIGLAIVKRIMQRHGGNIWAEAEVGKGATFHFTLGRVHSSRSQTAANRGQNRNP